jgi:hypothetical protein
MMLGAQVYDKWFVNFECAGVRGGIAEVFVSGECKAKNIGIQYGLHVAIAVETVLKKAVKSVSVSARSTPR